MNDKLSKFEKRTEIGVFLCECGNKIASKVDLAYLKKDLSKNPLVTHVEISPFPCMAPGIENIKSVIESKGLDRVLIAGCEERIMLKKIERELEDTGFEQGDIGIVNLRDHVAGSFDGDPESLAVKGSKLIKAALASLNVYTPGPKKKVDINGPVMIVGSGIATYSAAKELIKHNIDVVISVYSDDVEDEIRMLHETYPGERHYHDHLRKVMQEVIESPYVKLIVGCDLEKVKGKVGDYTLTFKTPEDDTIEHKAGAIIAALDTHMFHQGSEFGHDGEQILCHTEMEEYIWLNEPVHENVVFWLNDLENNQPWSQLSARSAWNMARYIKEHSGISQVSILYNDKISLPLGAAERALSRKLGIGLVPYDGAVTPAVQSGFITFARRDVLLEEELSWEKLILSPVRHLSVESRKIAEILHFDIAENRFLERNPQMVRPEQIGQTEKFLAGSARKPCDLQETLRQGRRAATKVAEIVEKARSGKLYAPRMVVTVDESKCTGCGLCKQVCDCGGIEPDDEAKGGTPRSVDPMVCTGGGTCVAACPHNALTLQGRSFDQMEARVISLVRNLEERELFGFGCNWGGGAAADLAGLRGMKYDPRFYLLPIPCIGQLDPRVMARAFLEGANGLLLIGCPPEECHHSYGLDHTWARVTLIKKILNLSGLERERIALAHADLNNPEQYIRVVEKFIATIDELGPIVHDEKTMERLQGAYDTLLNPRVRWVLGAGLRVPWEGTYLGDRRNSLAYDQTLTDVLKEEFLRTRVLNVLMSSDKTIKATSLATVLEEDQWQLSQCLTEMVNDGLISKLYKDRSPYYNIL